MTREKWTLQENIELFALYASKKNHWKEISKSLQNRSDNSIKNQFFALLRKGLRKACRSVGLTHNTMKINTIKPKVLLDFFEKTLCIKTEIQNKIVVLSEYVEKFALFNGGDLNCQSTEQFQVVDQLIKTLTNDK